MAVSPNIELSRPWRLPAVAAFPLLAVLFFAFFAAASAPSPLFVVFQQQWGFSSAMLTVAFAIYAIALMISLLVAGALSDHIGRRPVVFAALLLQAGAMVIFMRSHSVGDLIWARIVQGVATGMVSGALSAAIVEAAPASHKRLGAMISSMSPLAGLAVGALLTGAAVGLTAHPVPVVFGSLAAICLAGAVAVLFAPETAERRPGALASLIPRMSVPPRARGEFVRSLPVTFSVWALGGLFLSLVPSLLQQVFDIHSGIVNGLAIAILFGVGAIAPASLGRWPPALAGAVGMSGIAVGVSLVIGSLWLGSLALFFVGAVVAGFGFGASFSAQVQALAPLADAHQRAELFAALYAASYLAFSVPAMLA
ncbi:MAG: transporter, partial [Polaromonas sp.]|nr:transporter [Polaromonas sp.]